MCQRCTSTRTRRLDAYGRRVGQSYSYAEGYLAPRGAGHDVTSVDGRADLRLAALQRILGTAPQQPADLDSARSARRAG